MASGVSLREPVEADVESFFRHQLEPEARRMAAFPSRDRAAFAAHWAKTAADPSVTRLTILADGRPAGYVACFSRLGLREVCYWLGKEFWGRGVATKALALFLDRVQERPLHARVAKSNVGSLRVVQACGFTIAGEDRFPDHNGAPVEEFLLKLG
ncbi:MAG: GNAT family N-acetyltransferase [Elusimicrobia bacterium]|nr:GNAT family N-acetyltransferase [Elusimicrobiota bacterium]